MGVVEVAGAGAGGLETVLRWFLNGGGRGGGARSSGLETVLRLFLNGVGRDGVLGRAGLKHRFAGF